MELVESITGVSTGRKEVLAREQKECADEESHLVLQPLSSLPCFG